MDLSCSICQDRQLPSQVCLVIQCGHLYHESCLLRWIQQKQSCPDCRANICVQPFRLFFNISKDQDQSTNGDLATRLDQAESDCAEWQAKCQKINKELDQLQKSLAKKSRLLEAAENALEQLQLQIDELRRKVSVSHEKDRKIKSLTTSLAAAERDLNFLKDIETMVRGTDEEVSKALSLYTCNEQSIRQLCTHVEVLRKQSEKYLQRCQTQLSGHQTVVKQLEVEKRDRRLLQEKVEELSARLARNSSMDDQMEKENKARELEIASEKESLTDLLSDSLMTPAGKDIAILSAKVNINSKRSSRNEKAFRGYPYMRPSKLLQNPSALPSSSSSSGFVYDGMGGSKRKISIPTPLTREEKTQVMLRAGAKSKPTKSTSLPRPNVPSVSTHFKSKTNQSTASDHTFSVPSVSTLFKSKTNQSTGSDHEESFIELD